MHQLENALYWVYGSDSMCYRQRCGPSTFGSDRGPVPGRPRRAQCAPAPRIFAAGCDRAQRIVQSIGIGRPTVWRWQQRFAEVGVESLLRDKTRKPGKAPIGVDKAAQLVAQTCTRRITTHCRATTTVMGLSVGSVQRIGRAHRLQPHRLRTFTRSRDPGFAAKLTDIVGLYVTSKGAGLAGAPSALDLSLLPDLRLMAQRRRELFVQDDPTTHPPRCLPLDRRPAGPYKRLSRRAQQQSQTVRLDPIRRRHSGQTRPPSCKVCLIQSTIWQKIVKGERSWYAGDCYSQPPWEGSTP
jgi:hypothetical protein